METPIPTNCPRKDIKSGAASKEENSTCFVTIKYLSWLLFTGSSVTVEVLLWPCIRLFV
jgi:hypothetical protein